MHCKTLVNVIFTVGGTTLHSGLGFKFGNDYLNITKEKLDSLKKQLEDVEVVIVDEMSMISSDFLLNINQRMKDLFDSTEDFGGRALVLAGDLLQLPPVSGTAIFKEPKNQRNKDYFNIQPTESKPGGNLWANCQVVYLKTNFRQGEGNPWTELLNRVRIGKPTEEDINLLKSRKPTLLNKEQKQKAAHLYFKNKDVMSYNRSMLRTISKELYEIQAKLNVPKGSNYKPMIDKDKGTIGRSNFSDVLQIKMGARVMLIYNVNIPDLLVNGSLGTVVGIELSRNGNVECIVVAFDHPKAGLEQINEHRHVADKYKDQRGCPIYQQTVEELISSRKGLNSGKTHGCSYKITQFPLRLAWGSTAHKVQGLEFKKGSDIITHGDVKMPNCMYYVMLSRAQALENVYNKNFLPDKLEANPDALEEDGKLMERSIVPFYEKIHFSFLVLNIRSLSKHFIDICQDMHAKRANHICLVETWIKPDQGSTIDFQMNDRSFEHASIGKGKGCAIYSSISQKTTYVGKIAKENYQILSILANKVQLVLCYLSSNCHYKDVLQDLKNLLKPGKNVIITGDFNFDKKERNVLTRYMEQEQFEQLVNKSTSDHGRTIDHCYVSKDFKHNTKLEQYSPYYSDHDALCITVNL